MKLAGICDRFRVFVHVCKSGNVFVGLVWQKSDNFWAWTSEATQLPTTLDAIEKRQWIDSIKETLSEIVGREMVYLPDENETTD